MHLRDRGGGQGLGVEAGKHRFGLVTQVFAQLRTQVGQRHGGHMAVQFFEFGDPFRAEQVGTTRQDLAELDKGGAQFFHGQAYLHRRLQPRQIGGMVPVQGVTGALETVGQPQSPYAVAEAMSDQCAQDVFQASQVTGGAQGLDHHGCMIEQPPGAVRGHRCGALTGPHAQGF